MEDNLTLRLLAATSYLGLFIIIPIMLAPNYYFINFHVKQGFILIVVWLLLFTSVLINEANSHFVVIPGTLLLLVFSITGIVNAIKGMRRKLPFIGNLVNYIDG